MFKNPAISWMFVCKISGWVEIYLVVYNSMWTVRRDVDTLPLRSSILDIVQGYNGLSLKKY